METKHQALLVGASDFLTKPFDHVEALLRIRHLLHIRLQHLQLAAHKDHLEDTVRERTAELRDTLGQLEESVHQLRSTQQQVVQHERMSALGSMAAGLAHDFNNALSLILGYGELLLLELEDSPHKERSDEFLGTIITAAQDAAKVFDRLRSFYRTADDDQVLEPLDVNALVEQAIALTRPRWHGQALGCGVTIDARAELAHDLPPLLADGAELREMLTNLIFNAVDAIPAPGGSITVATRFAPGVEDDPGSIILSVADTGVGMDEETRQRCLEPFFTTKGEEGTGLGLAMVYGTMKRHGGTIDLESMPGCGTIFTFSLPIRAWSQAEQSESATETGLPWSILVVDDQVDFLTALRGYLAKGGLDVETAHGGGEALEKFRARPFDLVITDKAMPGMAGEQLAETLKTFAPRTRVILLTGYSLSNDPATRSTAIDLAIHKPVTLAALRTAIGKVMIGQQPLRRPVAKRRRQRLAA